MPKNVTDVFHRLVGTDEDAIKQNVPGFVAYGLFWAELDAWIRHQVKDGKPYPTPQEIDDHIAHNIPESHFIDIENNALELFVEVSLDILKETIDEKIREAVDQSVVHEVKAHQEGALAEFRKSGNLWRQLGMALITAIVAPLILGAILVLINAYSHYASPADVATHMAAPAPAQP